MVKMHIRRIVGILTVSFFLLGCGSKDINAQRQECKEEGSKFYTKKALNFRTGEYEIKGICKT